MVNSERRALGDEFEFVVRDQSRDLSRIVSRSESNPVISKSIQTR